MKRGMKNMSAANIRQKSYLIIVIKCKGTNHSSTMKRLSDWIFFKYRLPTRDTL